MDEEIEGEMYADDEQLQERMDKSIATDLEPQEEDIFDDAGPGEEDEEPDHGDPEDDYWFGRE